MRKTALFGLATLALGLLTLTDAPGQTAAKQAPVKDKDTVIVVDDMDCDGCAAVVEIDLTALPDVAKVKIDVEKRIATVTPKQEKTLAPKVLWETIEKAGFTPSKLVGPSGTFNKKPAS